MLVPVLVPCTSTNGIPIVVVLRLLPMTTHNLLHVVTMATDGSLLVFHFSIVQSGVLL